MNALDWVEIREIIPVSGMDHVEHAKQVLSALFIFVASTAVIRVSLGPV